MKKVLLIIAFLAGTFLIAFGQNVTKISPSTRIVVADHKGKLSLDAAKKMVLEKKQKRRTAPSATQESTPSEDDGEDDGLPFALPFEKNGVKMVQCWIGLTDKNYAPLIALGVEIQAKFEGKVTANVPVEALEEIAALSNVTKVTVAKKLKKKTYVTRQMTNVDDVLNLSSDAQTAGLLQAYDGTGVVLGVIDTGIDFGHQMFSGRIKKKYIYNTTAEEMQEYTGSTAYYSDETHGTHTSSIAGGSDYSATAYVYTNSTSYTTVNNAKFGGMAPGSDLVLCDMGEELTDANMAYCMQLINDYATSVGKPYVISLSIGGHYGPHDGTGDFADVCAQYTGAGKVIVFAAGNEGEDNIYHFKEATNSNPAMTILSSQTRSQYSMDYGAAISYARTPNIELAARYYVVNTSLNTVVWTSNEITTENHFVDEQGNILLYGKEISINDTGSDGVTRLSNYFTAYNNNSSDYGYLCCYMDKDSHNNKWNVETILYYLKPVNSNYKIGMSIYPKTNGITSYIDSWPVSYLDFASSSASVSGHSFTAGTNHSSASDESSFPSVISVGAYCSSKYWRAGTTTSSTQAWTNNGEYQQISLFSSYQEEGYGPTGQKQPWITAPGEVILAAYNSRYTVESTAYYAYGTNKVLGAMAGTSMATPCVAGIVALWLQVTPMLTPSEIKDIMQETAIHDSYTSGTYASHFGNGKIDALAGVKYLLDHTTFISATPQNVTMRTAPGKSTTATITVKGNQLTDNITATLNDATGLFSIDQTSIAKTDAMSVDGVTLTITYTPTADEGNHNATITLSSTDAADVVITITGIAKESGKASDAYLDIAKYETIDEQNWDKSYVTNLYWYTEDASNDVAWLTLPVYGAWSSVYYAPNAQSWIKTNVNTVGKYYGTSWSSSSDVFLGSSKYFGSGTTSRAMGLNQRNNNEQYTVSFYVTNTEAVKLYGIGNSRTTNNRPATLKIFECTEHGDGTLNEETTAVKNFTNSSTSQTFVLSATDLDATKIYKVEATTTCSYLYEIGFQTPISKPAIVANQTMLNFNTTTGVPATQTFNLKGSKLKDVLLASLTDANGVYSVDVESVSITDAEGTNGKDVTVTFNPVTAGTYTGTITLSSTDATSVTVSLYGVATTPAIVVEPTELTMECEAGKTATAEFNVLATDLYDVVTVTLADENNVFTLDAESISITDAQNGKNVTVTFAPSEQGTYTGTVTLSSPHATESKTVTLNGIATKAFPDYYDVTISAYGLSTLYLDFPVTIPYDDYEDLLGVYYAKEVTGDEVKLRRINSGAIPALTGVVVQANAGTYRFPKATTVDNVIIDNQLRGSIEKVAVSEVLADEPEGSIVLTLGKGSNGYIGFYRYNGTMLNAYKVYIVYNNNSSGDSQSQDSKQFSLSFDDENPGVATGIRLWSTYNDGYWYTLQGARLNSYPTASGLYIHRGKVVLVK